MKSQLSPTDRIDLVEALAAAVSRLMGAQIAALQGDPVRAQTCIGDAGTHVDRALRVIDRHNP